MIVSKHVGGGIICEIIVNLLDILQNNNRCTVRHIEITSEYVNPATERNIPENQNYEP
jgi:hypothetical protein